MTLNLHAKLTALLLVYALLLTITLIWPLDATSGAKEVEYYVVCPDGQDNCTPYQPHEVKVVYK